MNYIKQIDQAYHRIKNHTRMTPLMRSQWLSDACRGEVYLKLESEQHTGSFKARGSLNKLMWLQEQGIDKMPVTASTGNHGLGFARALDLLGMKGNIFLPKNAVSSKVEAIKAFEVEVEFYGDDPYTTEEYAKKLAETNGWYYVSPYNDKEVIAGQGTTGKEITSQIEHADNLLATVGGGGLISGVATYLRETWPGVNIIGCQPENSPEMSVSVKAGKYQEVESKPTLSDGSAGGFEPTAVTFDLCQKLIDDFILVSEQEIEDAIRAMIQYHSKLIEGAAGVAVASLLQKPEQFAHQTTVIIICGANISLKKLQEILA